MAKQDAITTEAKELKAQLDKLAQRIQDIDAEDIDNVSEKIHGYVDEIKGKWQQAKGRVIETARHSKDYAEDNPWKTAAVAAGVGVLLGLMLRRR